MDYHLYDERTSIPGAPQAMAHRFHFPPPWLVLEVDRFPLRKGMKRSRRLERFQRLPTVVDELEDVACNRLGHWRRLPNRTGFHHDFLLDWGGVTLRYFKKFFIAR